MLDDTDRVGDRTYPAAEGRVAAEEAFCRAEIFHAGARARLRSEKRRVGVEHPIIFPRRARKFCPGGDELGIRQVARELLETHGDTRSEERRVGKECRYRWSRED